MAVRLNITMDEDLYERLKKASPPRKMSAFIGQAVKERLGPSRAELDAAYKSASRERWRTRLADEWSATETEGWPE